jgi:hypothetical protein
MWWFCRYKSIDKIRFWQIYSSHTWSYMEIKTWEPSPYAFVYVTIKFVLAEQNNPQHNFHCEQFKKK